MISSRRSTAIAKGTLLRRKKIEFQCLYRECHFCLYLIPQRTESIFSSVSTLLAKRSSDVFVEIKDTRSKKKCVLIISAGSLSDLINNFRPCITTCGVYKAELVDPGMEGTYASDKVKPLLA